MYIYAKVPRIVYFFTVSQTKSVINIYFILPRIYMSRCKFFVQDLIKMFRVKDNGQ
jgi:hypothetical protein